MNDKTLLVGPQLVGDVGGTNARFAVARMVDGKPVLAGEATVLAPSAKLD